MINGDSKLLFKSIQEEEKNAKQSIMRYYENKEKNYADYLKKRLARKKKIVREYYLSIAKHARMYMKKEYEYKKSYEDYFQFLTAFDKSWKKKEQEISENPRAYVTFAIKKFTEICGKPDRAVVSKEFHKHVKKSIPTKQTKEPMTLKLFRKKVYADFSPHLLRMLLLQEYAGSKKEDG